MGGVSYIHFLTVFNFANPLTRYVVNYFTMVTIQRKPRLLPTHPEYVYLSWYHNLYVLDGYPFRRNHHCV